MSDRDLHLVFYDEMTSVDWESPVIKKWLSHIPKMSYTKKGILMDTNVEDLIQASKDQNGRVYQKLREQEKDITNLDHERRRRDSHVCPVTSFLNSTPEDMFRVLVSRIGTKGILKMLAER